MNDKFYEKLTEYEKEVYKKRKKEKSLGNIKDNSRKIISPLNDLIKFNPFQYEPYYKLSKQEEYPKAVYIADEVGSGKTIETGIILTELIYQGEVDLLSDICVIICPNLLCRKWRDTLKSYFGIGASIVYSIKDIGAGINILSYDTISNNHDEINIEPTVLVMDEAHNASGDRYNKLLSFRKKVCEKKGYVVLLSATPLSGKNADEKKQIELLLLEKEIQKENFFAKESIYLCKNKKVCMRYATNPKKYTVNVNIKNHYIENDCIYTFKACCEEIFKGKNTLLQLQGLNMLMSSPQAGLLYLKRLLEKSDNELLEYLESSHTEIDEDDESEDDYIENEIDNKEYTLEDAQRIRKVFEGIKNSLEKMGNGEEKDPKLEAVLKIIAENEKNVKENINGEGEFYKHIIIFTDRLSTAKYLEEKLLAQKEVEIEVFRVTGELFESEKQERLTKYKNTNDKISVLIITNVACEGQDMDYGNTIVNYDLDYNPVRLEQRRGRIDRFDVKKDNIFMHNFMVKSFDYNPNENKADYDVYSKVKIIWDKIGQIKESTGTYYEILKNKEEPSEKEEDLEINKKKVFEHIADLAGADMIDSQLLASVQLQEKIVPNCLSQFGEYSDVYSLISDRMSKMNIKIEKRDNKQISISTEKNNQEFLNNIYYGGTLISHLILGEK